MVKEDPLIIQRFSMKTSKFLIHKTTGNTSRRQTYQSIAHNLSRDAKLRLKWILHYQKYRSARLNCRHFGLSPDTFYLWKKRFNPNNILSLEDDKKNRRTRNLRKPLLYNTKGLTNSHENNTL